jgi:hypothetical protein
METLRYRSAIVSKSLRYRYAIAALSLFNPFAIGAQQIYNHCVIAAQSAESLWNRRGNDVETLRYRCAIALKIATISLRYRYCYAIAALSHFNPFATGAK